MAQLANSQVNSSRALALARRKALSSSGKAGVPVQPKSTREPAPAQINPAVELDKPGFDASNSAATGNSRAASLARRRAMSSKGKSGLNSGDRTRTETMNHSGAATQGKTASAKPTSDKQGCGCGCKDKKERGDTDAATTQQEGTPRNARSRLKRRAKVVVKTDSGRATALARRKACSVRGKAGISKNGMSSAQTARASNPDLSGRDLARALRDQKSRRGAAGQKKSEPTGRMRPPRQSETGAAQDAPWKVGASDTSHGQTITGTMVGRSESVTGDEASTCRDVTGTEYLGADIFKAFCQKEPTRAFNRVGSSTTGLGNSVTGNQLGRSKRVTGDEPGTCKNVTGSEYIGAGQSTSFCASPAPARAPLKSEAKTSKGKHITGDNVGRSDKVTGDETGANRELTGTQYMASGDASAPAKVKTSRTLAGGSISGSMVGRSERVTGDEPGSCRHVTGDDYVGKEQYQSFCGGAPETSERKVGLSRTHNNKSVTGTMTGCAQQVTGDEPGTCKTVTGTPYAGAEQYHAYCEPEQAHSAAAHIQKNTAVAGASMTGLQPSVGGKMTGDGKGICETVSGTPYVGRDQMAQNCPSVAAEIDGSEAARAMQDAARNNFSVSSPARAAHDDVKARQSVTGSSYERGSITGPFGMATGKVTGTEEARFDRNPQPVAATTGPPESIHERPLSRITGEGMDAGPKITGDDWERGDRVTGTEGASSIKRNPTLRGSAPQAMAMRQTSRNEDMPIPTSPVTGGSGNTESGAFVTYSGGARG